MEKAYHPANTRGKANIGWLRANYSFSFANYFNPQRMQFGLLRVLNDDTISGAKGFPSHSHQNMEIITIPLKGAVKHKDSMDHEAVVTAQEVQVMSAGTGVEHSEYNAENDTDLNLLQLWIIPEQQNVIPRYDQKNFEKSLKQNELIRIVSPKNDQQEGSLYIHQQAYLHLGKFDENKSVTYKLNQKPNGVYIFLIEGAAEVADTVLNPRDAMGLWKTDSVEITFVKESKVLLIEVPMN